MYCGDLENKEQIAALVRKRFDAMAKPLDSLGLLEEAVIRIQSIYGTEVPVDLRKKAILVLAADHGVVCEGVTQTGQEVTKIVTENIASGNATVNLLAARVPADVYAVDIGMNTEPYPEERLVTGAVVNRKIRRGSGNIAREAAMTPEECLCAIETGKKLLRELKQQGYSLIGTGEMGIGNTTPTSVLSAKLLQRTAEEVTGRGAGLDDARLQTKIHVVGQTLGRIAGITDPIALLAEAGGLEIAGMTGIFLGAAEERVPVVIDGCISSVAALLAVMIDPAAQEVLLSSHESVEPTGKLLLEMLGLHPLICAQMRPGEGVGAAAVMPLMDMAMDVYRQMGSFEDYHIEAYQRNV